MADKTIVQRLIMKSGVVELRTHAVLRIVFGFAGSKKYAIVCSQAIVIEEVPSIRDSLSVFPSDRILLLLSQRIAYKNVVVKRYESRNKLRQKKVGKCIRSNNDLLCFYLALICLDEVVLYGFDMGSLV